MPRVYHEKRRLSNRLNILMADDGPLQKKQAERHCPRGNSPLLGPFLCKLWVSKSQGLPLEKSKWSERQDSNLRRLAPKASALPG